MEKAKWIKVDTDIFDDDKIAIIEAMPESDTILVIWFKLLVLAGKQNNGGVFTIANGIPLNDEMIAAIIHRPIASVRNALKTFNALGMIDNVNNVISIIHWNEHQSLDNYEQAKAKNRERQRRFQERKRQKLLDNGQKDPENTGNNVIYNADRRFITPADIEEDTDGESDVVVGTDKEADDDGTVNTLERYATANLQYCSPGNLEELITYRDSMDDDAIRYCIDLACANGSRKYSYVRRILNNCVDQGLKTVGDIKAREAEREREKTGGKPPSTFEGKWY